MIRYVLILAIAAVVLGLTGAALDGASATRGEQAIEAELETVESTAASLYRLEGTAREVGTARRVVEIDLPDSTLTRDGIAFIRFEPVADDEATRVTYRLDGGTNRTRFIDVPLQREDGEPVDFGPRQGTHRLVFELVRESDGDSVVAVSEYEAERADPDV